MADPLADEYRPVLLAQIDAINKIQCILGCTEIDFYVVRNGAVSWDGVPRFTADSEFHIALAATAIDGLEITSEVHCVGGHLFNIESDRQGKPYPFRTGATFNLCDGAPNLSLLRAP
ncbi:MAG: hypothetical protein HUU46_07010 [Candidatus Hydrogenedentes bacterium]|nr:hypothetical protein [Candidatus Hydrogenedentota bacterium]